MVGFGFLEGQDQRDPKKSEERLYFLEEKYPRFGNLVPRDVGAREIYDICVNQGLGVHGDMKVYLDLTHHSREFLDRRLGGILEIYEKFTGVDPRESQWKSSRLFIIRWEGFGLITPGQPMVYRSSVSSQPDDLDGGPYAAGEADYQYHGANRLGANSLLSCIYWLDDGTRSRELHQESKRISC